MDRRFLRCLLGVLVLLGTAATSPLMAQIPNRIVSQSQPTGSFQTLHDKVKQKIEYLDNLILARESDFHSYRARITVEVCRKFVTFAQWDHAHPESLATTIGKWRPVYSDRKNLARELPWNELNDCLKILAAAQKELESSPRILKLSHAGDLENATMVDGNYKILDRPCFPFGIFRAPLDLPQSFGKISFVYIQPKDLNRQRPAINSGQKSWFRSELNKVSTAGKKAYLFLGDESPAWATSEAIQKGRSMHVPYNIDHPIATRWWQSLIDGFGAEFSRHPAALDLVMLANEPHWFSTNTPWGHIELSEITLARFHDWLRSRHGTIEQLNACWGTSHHQFGEVRFELPFEERQQQSGLWYDWCRFNMDRGSGFFQMLDTEVKRFNPGSLNHVKTPSQLFLDTQHDHGIDWYQMAQKLGALGVDSTMTSNQGTFELEKTVCQNRYSIEWVQSVATIDLLKSIGPNKPMIDLEWHGISSIHWRNAKLTSEYVRSGLWLNYLAGLSVHQSWYWSREVDGAPSKLNQEEFYGSLLTQPIALNSYLRTMAELNQHAEQVVRVVKRRPIVGLLYCEDAAIQDKHYLANFSEVYQALKFTGLPLRMIPVRQVAEEPTICLDGIQVLVIPPTQSIGRQLFKSIDEKLQQVPRIIHVGDKKFQMNVYGNRLPESKTTKRADSIPFSAAENGFKRIVNALSHELERNGSVLAAEPAWGLLQYSTGSKTNRIKVLINVSLKPIRVLVSGTAYTIDPMETKIIKE